MALSEAVVKEVGLAGAVVVVVVVAAGNSALGAPFGFRTATLSRTSRHSNWLQAA